MDSFAMKSPRHKDIFFRALVSWWQDENSFDKAYGGIS